MYRSALLDMNFEIYSYFALIIIVLSSIFLLLKYIKPISFFIISGLSILMNGVNIIQSAIFYDELNLGGKADGMISLIIGVLLIIGVTIVYYSKLSRKKDL